MSKSTPTELFDPTSPELIEDPHPFWALARREQPIFFSDELQIWIVTRYDDVLAVLKDTKRFVSRDSFDPLVPLPDSVQAILDEGWENYLVGNVDPPEHTPLRKAVNRVLKRSKVEEMTPLIHSVTDELISGFAARGHADIATEFARLLPALVVSDIVGVPREDAPNILHWGHDFETILAAAGTDEELLAAARGLQEYQAYFVAEVEERRKRPRDDLLSAIVEEFDNDPDLQLSTEQIANMPLAVFTAGHNTTSRAICNGLLLLLKRPDARERIEEDSSLIPQAFEEILRYEAPFPFIRRTLLEETELDGTVIPAGATVMLSLASANYDSCPFAENPAEFDICRPDAAKHLTFGNGIHFCPGAPLARREVAIALEALLQRLPNLRLVAYKRLPSFAHRGFSSMEVEWDAKT